MIRVIRGLIENLIRLLIVQGQRVAPLAADLLIRIVFFLVVSSVS